jgi:hypothetical protein
MSLGMTYDEFWNQNVDMARAYRKADEMRRRRENETLWVQGLYVRDALISTVGNMFAGKGSQKNEYPKEPYAITELEIREREEREIKIREERIKANFAAFAAQMMKKMPAEAHPGSKGGEINERSNND